MPRRAWDATTTALSGLEGLNGNAVAGIGTEHRISPSQYSQWRDRFLAHAARAFAVHQHTRRAARPEHENSRLQRRVGGRTLE
jgi:hypothetical protein